MNLQALILRIALPTTLHRQFDYLAPQDIDITQLKKGIRVLVPFQSRTLVGILMDLPKTSSVPYQKLKIAHSILDLEPIFPTDVQDLCQWAADYYHSPIGDVFNYALPTLLRKGKSPEVKKATLHIIDSPKPQAPHALNAGQQQALREIIAAHHRFQPFLLDGVTGSGKTEVYLQAIDFFLQQGKQILVLVPEISLTPQTIARFAARFDVAIATWHSNLSDRQKLNIWCAAKANHIQIIIGTRSAIFTPLQNLGLIIVDEEHDNSFKQQDRFRYHARDLSIMRARMKGIPIVLGSATPSLASLLNGQKGRYHILNLPERAGNAVMPTYQLIDVSKRKSATGISDELIMAMQTHLKARNQVMLFLNRRGFAPVLYCGECSWIATCKRCDSKLVYHSHPEKLQCHLCDARQNIPSLCPDCKIAALEPIGLGTQRVEQTIQTIFPDIPIIRLDRDSTKRKGSMQTLLDEINQTECAILLGTQMLAKGHHFPNVTLVGILDADSGFLSADYQAPEQMGQLLIQVGGRAGRAEKPGTVLVQTRQPQHPLIQQLLHQGYPAFTKTLLAERECTQLPPYTYLAVCKAESFNEEQANHFLFLLKKIGGLLDPRVSTLGPVAALIAKRKGYYCKHLIFRCADRKILQQYLKNLLEKLEKDNHKRLPVKWVLDVDPLEI